MAVRATRQSDADAPGAWAALRNELQRRSLRGAKRALRPLWMRRLDQRNRDSREPLLSAGGPVVSLTTYEPRWHSVHYTIESIGAGALRPSRLVLWVAPSVLLMGMPDALLRLQARGLEIQSCEDLGPHKKDYPLVAQDSTERPLVTADDDVLYWDHWLHTLVAAARERPAYIHAHRVSVMAFDDAGAFRPYLEWSPCRNTRPSALHFFTGVGGVLYPPPMQAALREAGDAFRASCPRADDIWLNAVALRSGIRVCQARAFSPLLFEVPGTREHGLARENRDSGGNDHQLAATYAPHERAWLQALAREGGR